MAGDARLALLKADLGMLGQQPQEIEAYLSALLAAAANLIQREGAGLADTTEDDAFVAAYAAWLYRKRAGEPDAPMPRMLRWQLNLRVVGRSMSGGISDDL